MQALPLDRETNLLLLMHQWARRKMADLLNDIQTAEFREAFNEFDKVKKPITNLDCVRISNYKKRNRMLTKTKFIPNETMFPYVYDAFWKNALITC